MALGEVDYGLMGVVGGMTVFISFLNGWLASSTGRFYAYAIGMAQKNPDDGLEECRKWFSTAMFIHTVVPVGLMIVGYPLGSWAVSHFLTIPPDRISACLWVFRFVCVSCFVGMISVPFNAMYGAKQYIAELTLYSFVTSTLNIFVLYYMLTHIGKWLVCLSAWSCLLSIAPQVIITIRAIKLFPECRLRLKYCLSKTRFKQLSNFAGWQLIGSFAVILQGQGVAVLVNKFFGPPVNAAMAIANTVNGHANSLASSLLGAFMPAITTACGAGDMDRMRKLAFGACKFGMVLLLIFIIPLAAELKEVVRLWLKNPPQYTVGLCWCLMIVLVMDTTTIGHMAAILAKGRIALYQVVLGGFRLMIIPLAWIFVANGFGVYSVGVALAIVMSIHALLRLVFAERLVDMSCRYWVRHIMGPVFAVSLVSFAAALSMRCLMSEGFGRVVITTVVSETLFLPFCWMFVLEKRERDVVLSKVKQVVRWSKNNAR